MSSNTAFWKQIFAGGVVLVTLLFTALAVMPDDAEARRMGGGGSFGSRGSQSYSTPKAAPAQRTASQPSSATTASPSRGGMMGVMGGLLMGGLLGSLLFGGMEGGFGLLEVLLLGGLAYFLYKKFIARAAPQQAQPAGAYRESVEIPPTFSKGGSSGGPFPLDEVTHGLRQIAAQDPAFREDQFLEGARRAFDMLQDAWSNWRVDTLQPFVTDRLWGILQTQDRERRAAQRRDMTENVQYQTVEISQVWQEAGQDWITVHYVVTMLEYATDPQGRVVEGSDQHPNTVEEYWTFCRDVGSSNPNWLLSAIQQPGEVASSSV